MKLIYFTSFNYPSRLANNLQVLQMSLQFQNTLGKENFSLILNYNNDNSLKDLNNFTVNCSWEKMRVIYYFFWFLKNISRFFKKNDINIIYCKDSYLCMIAIFFRKFFNYKVCFEYHLLFNDFRDKFLSKKCDYIVSITSFIKKELVKQHKIYQDKILIASDAVNLEMFDLNITKEEARFKLNLEKNKIILGYSGSFTTMGMDKGLNDIFKALKLLNNKEVIFIAVGGSDKDIRYYNRKAKELNINKCVILLDHQDQKKLAIYQKAFDILLMPFPYNKHYAYYMSPLKMFEYMASKRSIIASDLPSIREILNNENSVLVKPDNPESLAKGIKKILLNSSLSDKISKQSFKEAKNYTWQKRVDKILAFLKIKIETY